MDFATQDPLDARHGIFTDQFRVGPIHSVDGLAIFFKNDQMLRGTKVRFKCCSKAFRRRDRDAQFHDVSSIVVAGSKSAG